MGLLRAGCLVLCLLILPLLGWAACTPSELEDELLSDDMSLGYAAHVASGNDAALLSLLTTVREGEDYLVSKGVVPKDVAMGTWADVIAGIPFIANATLRTKWTWNVEVLFINRASVNYADAQTTAFFAQMVSDGLLTSAGTPITAEEITARSTRPGSRAEVVCGITAAERVTINAISCALRGQRCD